MTVADLIATTLHAVRNQWYADRVREFCRDEVALKMAIARWGHECMQRGWDFQSEFILEQLMELLNEIKRSGADIQYMPMYLHGAVGRWIGQRAEELSARAKSVPLNTAKIVRSLERVEAVREPTVTETLAALYADLKARKKRPAAAPAKPVRAKQQTLF